MTKRVRVAICYDFDGTLSPGNMQEYGFFTGLGMTAKKFWEESMTLAKAHHADPILAYMKHMIVRAGIGKIKTTRQAFLEYGRSVELYDGVLEWFDRMNMVAASKGIVLEHYIVSSGLKEMIEGTAICQNFKKVYACSFMYDQNNVAEWPAVAVNYTTKTQFIFRINKGIEDDDDHQKINAYVPDSERPVPFKRMIYVGDGATDVPCMRLVKENGGYAVAVYPPKNSKKRKEALQLAADSRVNFIAPADYTPESTMSHLLSTIFDRIATEAKLQEYYPKP